MYKLIEIDEAMMTRDIKLKNLKTGVLEICFDDSGLFSDDCNFEFMEIGKEYDCKILLFGNRLEETTENLMVKYKVNREVCIGKRKFLEVERDGNIYYLNEGNIHDEHVYYAFTRKDIIQVSDIIHYDLLRDRYENI